MPSPLIDIFIPTYEPNPDHLRAAIESVIAQSERDWMLLVYDDNSTMDVRSIVYEYIRDPRVCFMGSRRSRGIGGNWNASMSMATAPYFQFLFQDDTWEPNYVEEMVKVLKENPSAKFASADHRYDCEKDIANAYLYQEVRTFRNEHITEGLHKGQEFLHEWIKRELHPNVIGEPSFVMFTKALRHQVGDFAEDLPQFLDVEYWLRCLLKSDWYYLKKDLGSFRVHSKGASAQNQESGAGIYDRLECFERLLKWLPAFSELRSSTKKARNSALVTMARKFLKRRKEGKNTPVASSGKFKKFALRHPVLIGSALLKALLHKQDPL